jgi:hypothetical protein
LFPLLAFFSWPPSLSPLAPPSLSPLLAEQAADEQRAHRCARAGRRGRAALGARQGQIQASGAGGSGGCGGSAGAARSCVGELVQGARSGWLQAVARLTALACVTSRYLENRDTRFWYYICMPICMLAMEYVGSTKARGISVISTKCRFFSVT